MKTSSTLAEEKGRWPEFPNIKRRIRVEQNTSLLEPNKKRLYLNDKRSRIISKMVKAVATVSKKTCQKSRQNALRVSQQSVTIRKEVSEEPHLGNLMEKLKEAVPSLQDKTANNVSSLDIIQHAIFYIHDLWSALDTDEENALPHHTADSNTCSRRHHLSTPVF